MYTADTDLNTLRLHLQKQRCLCIYCKYACPYQSGHVMSILFGVHIKWTAKHILYTSSKTLMLPMELADIMVLLLRLQQTLETN